MELTCNRERLLAAFQLAASVAPARSPKTILQNVMIDATGNEPVMMATDMDVGIRVSLDGIEVQRPGSAILPVDRFGAILRESSDEQLALQTEETTIRIRGARSQFQLPLRDAAEFPVIREAAATSYHEIPSRLFREIIRRTVFATDVESTRYALGGVLLEFDDAAITGVGTDGRRLAKMVGAAHGVNGHRGGDMATIVPTRSMQLIERCLADDEGNVQISSEGNDVSVRGGSFVIHSRLVEGRFPKWRDVFPKRSNAVKVDLPAGPLLSAVRQASVVNNNDSRGLDFQFGEGTLVLSGSTADIGESRVEFPVTYSGRSITVTLDYRFVSDFLRVLDPQKNVTVEIESPESAALFETDDGYGYVVMPLARDR